MDNVAPLTILWIDDDPKESLKGFFEQNGFNIIVKPYYDEGIAWLENPEMRSICDAVLLDVNSKSNAEQKQPSMESFTQNSYKVYALCEKDKVIPWFVLTAGTGYDGAQSLDHVIPASDSSRRYYIKADYGHLQALAADIRRRAGESENATIRNRYPGIWEFCTEANEAALFRVIKEVEVGHWSNTSVFVDMRAVLAATVTRGKLCGLFPEFISVANEAKTILRLLSSGDDELVPTYISYNYATLCDTVNNGCHTEDEDANKLKVHPDVSGGKAPYLINAAFFQLLSILKWFGLLSSGEKTVPVRARQVDEILGLPTVGDKIRLDRNGRILHYKNACAWCKDATTLSDDDLRFEYFEVFSRELNTSQSSKEYPFFIKVKLA